MATRTITTIFAFALGSALVAGGCAVEDASEGERQVDSSETEADRGKLGKADHWGSCKAITHDDNGWLVQKNYCGGKSYGSCWCDPLCVDFGDCCDDYQDSCDEPEFCTYKWVDFWYPVDNVITFKRRVYRKALSLLEPMADSHLA